jgi:protein-disulfide isomerase/uncharacterized membrane protein
LDTLRRAIVLLLVSSGLLLATLLLFAHHGEGPAVSTVEKVCGEAGGSSCHEVNTGPYSSLGRVPLAAAGIVFYASLGLLLCLGFFAGGDVAKGGDRLALGLLALAVLVDLGLLGVQALLIHRFCILCLLTYGLNLAALVLLLGVRKASLSPLRTGAGPLFLAAWALGSLALLVGTASAEATLALRERLRAPLVLGTAPPADAEVKRLQGILDDPVKLDQYLNEKASHDFDVAPVVAIDLKNAPFRGPESAPIKVVDYSDFLCPFCRQAALGFANWLPQSGGRVAIYYKNYPLETSCNDRIKQTIHPGACVVALGGLCADSQGKFWPYHDKIFSGPPPQNPTAQDVVKLASEAGLDGQAMAVCLASEETKKRLIAQIHEGSDGGVQGTPSVFVNGKKLPRIDHFLEAIDKESRRLLLAPLPSPHP